MFRMISRFVNQMARLPSWIMLLAALSAAGVLCLVTVHEAGAQNRQDSPVEDLPGQLHLPLLSSMIWQQPICRLGLNVAKAPASDFNLSQLRIGWYIDYKAHVTAPHPNGASYAPVINLEQVGDSDYISFPSGGALDTVIADNPGGDWIIGNEPDRRYYQNDMAPAAYAHAYHDLYYYIKSKDARARVFAGAIVQPTPVRLQYLDAVLQRYRERYGEVLPVDGWAIHNFILNERSCAYYNMDPAICWGADIPPGVDATDGLIITTGELQKTADVAFFKEQVIRFRQWMADHGYRNRPLYVSEYGILMPESYGFPPSLVNNYMTNTFDFLLTTADEKLGYAADDNRLVQRLAWYSTLDPSFNGSLFQSTTDDPVTPPFVLTAIGNNFRAYADAITVRSDFKLLGVTQQAGVSITEGQDVTLTLKAEVANAGNNEWPATATVRFYLGDPAAGGVELGSTNVQMAGCGNTRTVEFAWTDVPASANGQYVYARLQANGVDLQARVQVFVADKLLALPLIWRLGSQASK